MYRCGWGCAGYQQQRTVCENACRTPGWYGRIYDQTVQEFMHGSAGVETVCEVWYSFQAEKGAVFVALRNWKGPYRIGTAFLLSLLGWRKMWYMKTICAQTVIWSPNWYICRRLTRPGRRQMRKMTEKLPIIYNVKRSIWLLFLKQWKDLWFYGSFSRPYLSETENDRRVQK